MIDFSKIYRGLTNQQIVDAQKAESCPHGTIRGKCNSSMCVVWEIDELNEEEMNGGKIIDPDAIPFPE